MSDRPLTPRQQRFVDEYLLDLNAAAAYRRAGYRAANDHVASANAARLMAKDSISKAIATARQERGAAAQVTVEWVLTRLKEESVYRGPDGTASARVRATELCGKHLAMFTDRQVIEGGLTLDLVEELTSAPPADHHQNGKAPQGPAGVLPQ